MDNAQIWYVLIAGTVTWWFTVGSISQALTKHQTPPQASQDDVKRLFNG